MKSVFVLEHLHTHPDGEECWKKIGIYKTHNDALAAIECIKIQSGFSDHPNLIDHSDSECINGFNIDEYFLNVDHWEDGYVTVQA
jgi:hypothetical protein